MPVGHTDEADDVCLLRRVAEGDQEAFSKLYDRLSGPLFSLILRVLRSQSEAEEVLQEVFWQIWTKASVFRPELGSPFSWAVTMARRKAIDRLRSTSRHLQRIEAARTQGSYDEFSLPTCGDSMDSTECAAAVRAALSQLPPEQVHAIELAFFDGLTHVEISEALGVPVGTVKARIRRGMGKLRAPLSHIRHIPAAAHS